MYRISELILESAHRVWIMASPTLLIGGVGYGIATRLDRPGIFYALTISVFVSGLVLAGFIRKKVWLFRVLREALFIAVWRTVSE